MINGPIQTKTKGFLLLQFHPSPRLPVCVCGALLVWKERRSCFNFATRGGQIDEWKKERKKQSSIDLFEMTVGELVIEAAKPMTVTQKETHIHTLEYTCTPTHPTEADKDEKLTAKSAKFLDHVKLQ